MLIHSSEGTLVFKKNSFYNSGQKGFFSCIHQIKNCDCSFSLYINWLLDSSVYQHSALSSILLWNSFISLDNNQAVTHLEMIRLLQLLSYTTLLIYFLGSIFRSLPSMNQVLCVRQTSNFKALLTSTLYSGIFINKN